MLKKNVMDDYSREALRKDVDFSIPSRKVVYVLDRLTKKGAFQKI